MSVTRPAVCFTICSISRRAAPAWSASLVPSFLARAFFHDRHGLARFHLDTLDEAGNVLCCPPGPLGEFPHLVGHNGETFALLTGARGLDCRIESKKVGLRRDLVDHLDDGADLE